MKKLLLLIPLVALLSGCNHLSYEIPNGPKLSRTALGTKNAVSELTLEIDPVTGVRRITLKGYVNDQVQGIGAVAEGVAKGLAAGVTP